MILKEKEKEKKRTRKTKHFFMCASIRKPKKREVKNPETDEQCLSTFVQCFFSNFFLNIKK
jgi:hypothetical protein